MEKIGIVDADLIYRQRQRFPNLACMKISGFYKKRGYRTELLFDYDQIETVDKVIISKVFTDTYVPEWVLCMKNVTYGGTGFFYDKAPALPTEIEHQKPDYGLYQRFVEEEEKSGKKAVAYKFYTDYSIGFLTRGCFRKCGFCVNKNSERSVPASPIEEFLDENKKKLCFLDDNFLACKEWEHILESVLSTEKPFQFRQGLDIRIMQRKQMEKLFKGKRDGNVMFAFDDIRDWEVIRRKLELLHETVSLSKKELKFYVLCGFDRSRKWEQDFWIKDLKDTMKRVEMLMYYSCLPYIMRYEKWKDAPEPYRGMYITISRWCNQPAQFKKKSLREFCIDNGADSSAVCYCSKFEQKHPEFSQYLDMKYEEVQQHREIYRG